MPDGARPRRCAAAPRRALRVGGFVPFTSTDYPGRACGGRVLPGLPVALRLLPQPASHPARGERRARLRADPRLARVRVAACSTRSCSPAASRRRRRSFATRSTRCARWASRSGCTRAARIRGASRECCRRSTGSASTSRRRSPTTQRVTGMPRQRPHRAREPRSRSRRAASRYEVRTTVHPALTPPDALERLARELRRAASSAGSCSRFARPAARTRASLPRRETARHSIRRFWRGCRTRAGDRGAQLPPEAGSPHRTISCRMPGLS